MITIENREQFLKALKPLCYENGFEMIVYNNNGGDWALKRIQ